MGVVWIAKSRGKLVVFLDVFSFFFFNLSFVVVFLHEIIIK